MVELTRATNSSMTNELKELISKNEIIPEAKVLLELPWELHDEWDEFMRGKTCPIIEKGSLGIYPWDLQQFLKKI